MPSHLDLAGLCFSSLVTAMDWNHSEEEGCSTALGAPEVLKHFQHNVLELTEAFIQAFHGKLHCSPGERKSKQN